MRKRAPEERLVVSTSDPPGSVAELLARADRLAGHTLGEVAVVVGEQVPEDFRRAKGWTGRVVERVLGAHASSRAEPDFPRLGIELKTIPVDREGRPRESTFVCSVPLTQMAFETWPTSLVFKKLKRVLFIPVQADPDRPIASRRLGNPLLWSPGADDLAILQEDWEAFLDLVTRGFVESVTAHRGTALQIRPKGKNARARRWGLDEEGDVFRTPPRAFYLRASFTAQILRRSFMLPSSGLGLR
ncbi:MAG: DNA mismatch repair endonuclease MutH [Deltaproteobacteria bacterium]|nr:DNA mismatch repair endonuclease MutH [Deltaproteobacteria bacterium]